MTPFEIIVGDCRVEMRAMPADSVHCVVTSIPYWGLRDYGIEPSVWGGDEACEHDFSVEVIEQEMRRGINLAQSPASTRGGGKKAAETPDVRVEHGFCRRCGAWRGAFGLEPDYRMFVEHAVEVFREVARVLRPDGTVWLNVGDCYATGAGAANVPGGIASSDDGARTVDWGYRSRAAVPTSMTHGHNGFGTSGLTNGGAYQAEAPRPRGRPPAGATAQAGYGRSGRGRGTSAPRAAQGKHEYVGDGVVGSNRAQRGDGGKANGIAFGPMTQPNRMPQPGLKPKDRALIPHRLAIALCDDGWWVRDEIVWHKPNPMPESTDDRTTKSHEFVFLLTKRPVYYFDNVAIAEPVESNRPDMATKGIRTGLAYLEPHLVNGVPDNSRKPHSKSGNKERKQRRDNGGNPNHPAGQSFGVPWEGSTRNKRSVWTIATSPFPEAHFATFPPALVEPCVLAGTSERGCCPACGAGWERVTAEVETGETQKMADGWDTAAGGHSSIHKDGREAGAAGNPVVVNITLGFYPGCGCYDVAQLPPYPPKPSRANAPDEAAYKLEMVAWRRACEPVTAARKAICDAALALPIEPAVVLDPFGGAGTAPMVARRLGRRGIMIEQNPQYAALARARIEADGMTKESAAATMARAAGRVETVDALPLFGGNDAYAPAS